MRPAVVGLDVAVAQCAYQTLMAGGVDPVEACNAEPDHVWVERAVRNGAVAVVSHDSDVRMLAAYESLRSGRTLHYIDLPVRMRGLEQARFILLALLDLGLLDLKRVHYTLTRYPPMRALAAR